MKICDVHDIAYDDRYCPCCTYVEKIEELKKEIEYLKEEVEAQKG